MEDQEILPCIMCNQHHEQMLMLSCIHDPCINCAATQYVENQPVNSHVYTCAKCGQSTQLDSSSIVELQKIYHSLKGRKKYDYKKNSNLGTGNNGGSSANKNSRTKINQTYENYTYEPKPATVSKNPSYQPYQQKSYKSPYTPPQPYNNISTNKKTNQTPTNLVVCQDHPEDELTYFCFTCNKPICPQCAIHGSHREHEVQTTRKAIKQIKGRLIETNQKLSSQIGHLVNKKQQSRRQLKQYSDQNRKDHEQIKKKFNVLRNLLVQKQKEFYSIVDQNYEKNCQESKNYSLMMDKIIDSYNNTRKNIDNTLKKDDVTILQQFSRKEEEANNVIDKNSTLSQQSRIALNKQVDYSLFDDQVEQLTGILKSMRLNLTTEKNRQYKNQY